MRVTKAFSSHRMRIGMTKPEFGLHEVWLEVILVKNGSHDTSRLYTHPEQKGPMFKTNQHMINMDTFIEEIVARTVAKSIEKAKDLWKEKFNRLRSKTVDKSKADNGNTSASSPEASRATKRKGSPIPDNDPEHNKKMKLAEKDCAIDEDQLLSFVDRDVVKRWHDFKQEENMEDHLAMMIGLQKYFGTLEKPPIDLIAKMRTNEQQKWARMVMCPAANEVYSQLIWKKWIGDAEKFSFASFQEVLQTTRDLKSRFEIYKNRLRS